MIQTIILCNFCCFLTTVQYLNFLIFSLVFPICSLLPDLDLQDLLSESTPDYLTDGVSSVDLDHLGPEPLTVFMGSPTTNRAAMTDCKAAQAYTHTGGQSGWPDISDRQTVSAKWWSV